jgi:hypothetical protein
MQHQPLAQATSSDVKRVLPAIMLVLGALAGAGAYHFALVNELITSPAPGVLGETVNSTQLDIPAKLAKLLVVNHSEVPSIATIIDASKLKASGEPFYVNVEDGDKLVVYSDKAILFREQQNLIVNVVSIEQIAPTSK